MLTKKSEKKEEVGKPDRAKIPDEVIAVIVQEVYKRFGESLVNVINTRVSQHLEHFLKRVEEVENYVHALERDINYLKTMSDEKTRELLRATLEVGMESIAEKSAKRAVDIVGVGNVEKLFEALSKLSEHEQNLIRTIESLSDEKENMDKMLSELRSAIEEIKRLPSSVVAEVNEGLNNSLNAFIARLEEAINEASEEIRKNLGVDKRILESVVERSLKVIVENKFDGVVTEMEGLNSRMEALEKSVKEFRKMEEMIAGLFGELDSLKNLVKERSYEEVTDLKQSIEDAAKEQDEITID